jgi:hypothetical protein
VTHSVAQALEVVIKPGAVDGKLVHDRTMASDASLVKVYDTVVLENAGDLREERMGAQEFSEAGYQRPEPILTQRGQQLVEQEQEPLPEERELPGPCGSRHVLHAQLLPGLAEQREPRIIEHRQQEEHVAPIIARDLGRGERPLHVVAQSVPKGEKKAISCYGIHARCPGDPHWQEQVWLRFVAESNRLITPEVLETRVYVHFDCEIEPHLTVAERTA